MILTLYVCVMTTSGADPRAPHIEERREFWILTATTGKVLDVVRDYLRVHAAGEASDPVTFQSLVSSMMTFAAYWATST